MYSLGPCGEYSWHSAGGGLVVGGHGRPEYFCLQLGSPETKRKKSYSNDLAFHSDMPTKECGPFFINMCLFPNLIRPHKMNSAFCVKK